MEQGISITRGSLVPRPPYPAFVACSTKSGEKQVTKAGRGGLGTRLTKCGSLVLTTVTRITIQQFTNWLLPLLNRGGQHQKLTKHMY